jgi:CRISPR system Cascade subunit CasD
VDRPGTVLRDFHTAEVPTAAAMRKRQHWTRADELAVGKTERSTIVSWRDYRSEMLAVACLWQREATAAPDLEAMAAALRQPVFAPYLGRKSCPPALPFAPRVLEAAGLVAALHAYDALQELPPPIELGATAMLYWEAPVAGGPETWRPEHRRDGLGSRRRWQFVEREERVSELKRGDGA